MVGPDRAGRGLAPGNPGPLIGLARAAAAAFFIPAPAQGAPGCAPRAEALAHLAKQYRERRIAVGVSDGGGLVEVLASPDGATWTILVTAPNGISCVAAAGEGWTGITAEDPEA